MSGSHKIILLALIVVLLLVAGVWILRASDPKLDGIPEESLISQIETASDDRHMRIVRELASRGDEALPHIVEAFEEARGRQEIQNPLIESVFRMRPSTQTIAALERMGEFVDDQDTARRIRALAFEHKRMAARAGAR